MSDVSGGRLVGRTISHYRVVAALGAGGMGVVYRGEDVRLGRPVAIKFVADDFANDAQAVARLRAEARAASALNHPNICTIYDIGTDDGHPFIVMELMEGQTLRDRLTRGRLKTHELVDVGIQIADALQGAHTAGIMHRDIKPANIFLVSGRGQVKILDFGLAKLTDRSSGPDNPTLESADLTAAGTTLGTVAYMSPEQATGEDLDGRTDLFSLGVVLYECATGRQPFEGKTHAVVLNAILNRSPTPPGALNPELPARLQEVIATCLEKDRELRYQSAADLRADLKRVRRDLESGRAAVTQTSTIPISTASAATTVSPVRHSSATMTTVATPDHVGATQAGPSAPRRGQTAVRIVGGVAVLAAVAGGAYALRSRTVPSTQAEVTAGAAAPDELLGRLSLARESLAAGNYHAAQSYAAEVLARNPDHAEARRLRDEAAAALTRLDEALRTARERLAADDLQGAARAVATARDMDPTSPAVSELATTLAARVRGLDASASARPASSAPPGTRVQPPTAPTVARASRDAERPGPAASVPAQEPPRVPPPVAAPIVATTPPPAVVPEPASGTPAGRATAPAPPAAPAASVPSAETRTSASPTARPSSSDDEAVRRVVSTYARSIEGKDIALFRTVKPNVTRDEERRLQEGFRAVVSQQVHLVIGSVELRDQEATVVAQRQDVIEAGGRRQTVESRQTFRLTRTQAGWVIADIR